MVSSIMYHRDQVRFHKSARIIGIIDLVLSVFGAISMICLGALVQAHQVRLTRYHESLSSPWIVWTLVWTRAVFHVIQVVAAVHLIKSTKQNLNREESSKLAVLWKNITIPTLAVATINDVVIVVAIHNWLWEIPGLTLLSKAVFLFFVMEYIRELERKKGEVPEESTDRLL